VFRTTGLLKTTYSARRVLIFCPKLVGLIAAALNLGASGGCNCLLVVEMASYRVVSEEYAVVNDELECFLVITYDRL
jgi:hypothetical protein